MRFAGLLPGFAGDYQVNFVVPEGIASAAAEVDLETGGPLSNTVTVAIRQ